MTDTLHQPPAPFPTARTPLGFGSARPETACQQPTTPASKAASMRLGQDHPGRTHERGRQIWAMATGRMRWTRRIVGGMLAVATLAVFLGYVAFARNVASYAPASHLQADGIVVLTGGDARLREALALLGENRAERLLITGVHPDVDAATLAKNWPDRADLFACCIDLDYRALDTSGNAAETGRWIARTGYTSLIVVTSDYHMPRSLLELSAAMPDVELLPHPVTAVDRSLKLVTSEYAKYMIVSARQFLGQTLPG
ncbi:MAG: YdcF family protein, partial [Pseudomonadota bacterium]